MTVEANVRNYLHFRALSFEFKNSFFFADHNLQMRLEVLHKFQELLFYRKILKILL